MTDEETTKVTPEQKLAREQEARNPKPALLTNDLEAEYTATIDKLSSTVEELQEKLDEANEQLAKASENLMAATNEITDLKEKLDEADE